MKTLKRLFSYYKPYLGIMILYLFMGVVIVSLAMLLPQITKFIIGSVIQDTEFSFLSFTPGWDKPTLFLALAAAWMCIVVLRQCLAYVRSYLMANASIKAVCQMREDVFRKMLWQSQSFLHAENTGNIMTVINGDTEVVKNFFTATMPGIVEAVFGFVFASIMVGRMSPWLLLGAYIFLLPIFFLSRTFSKLHYQYYHYVREASADLSMDTQENLTGIRIVKAFAQEKQENEKFAKYNNAFRYHAINYMVLWGKLYIPFGIISHLPNIVLTLTALYLTLRGHMSVAEFIAVGGYVGYILVPFQQMNNWLNQAQQAVVSGEKVFRFLNIGSSVASLPNATAVDTRDVHLRLEDAAFRVNGKVVVEHINLDLPQGKRIGIMGATGSGKTMITNLMMRFYDVTEGSVTVNGTDVRSLDLVSLRSCFAPVIQDVFLFSDTISSNILFGRPEASDEEMRTCAEIAQADNFIAATPDGYETIVGERGMGLSGGQKQRISIARALLVHAPVLIFDDATSALDMETEQALQQQLRTHSGNQSQVIIAHRISSVKDCDEILVLDKGRVAERGTHDELLAKKGEYYTIYREQYSAVLEAL